MTDEFKAALRKAREELAALEAKEKELAVRKTQLLQSIAGLAPLCGEAPPVNSLTLADAIRTVMQNRFKTDPDHPLTPRDVRDQLAVIGFDLSQFNNEMASIGTALKRMLDAGELEIMGDVAFSNLYRWRNRGLKPPPGRIKLAPRSLFRS